MYTMTMRTPNEQGQMGNYLKLYDPTLTEYGLEAPEMQLEANTINTLTFTIYDWNPRFNDLQLRKSVIYVYRDGSLRMVFRPIKRKLNFQGGVEYTCEELTGLLNDIMLKNPKMENTTAKDVILSVINGWTSEASEGTVVIPDKAVLLSLLTADRTAFTRLRPNSPYMHGDLHVGEKQSYELNTALYMLGFPVTRSLTWFYVPDQVYYFMQWCVAHPEKGMTTTQAHINASGKGDRWEDANNMSNQTGPYYDLLKLVNDTIDSIDHGDVYQYPSIYPASFAFDTAVDAPASDYIYDFEGDITIEEADFAGCWDYLQENIVDEYGGYLMAVWESETQCRIKYVTDEDLPLSNQTITLGENMVDLFVENDTTDVFTTIIPVKEDGTAWDIGTIPAQNGQKFVVLESLFQLYGRKDTTKEFEGSTVSEVFDKILEWVRDKTPIFKPFIQARAYDLKYAGVNVDYITWMERIQVVSQQHNVLESYPIRAATIVMDSPGANEYELGEEPPSIADQINDDVRTLEKQVSKNTATLDVNTGTIAEHGQTISGHTTDIQDLGLRVSALEGR